MHQIWLHFVVILFWECVLEQVYVCVCMFDCVRVVVIVDFTNLYEFLLSYLWIYLHFSAAWHICCASDCITASAVAHTHVAVGVPVEPTASRGEKNNSVKAIRNQKLREGKSEFAYGKS